MKRRYSHPQLAVTRMTVVNITTVSTETPWDDAWNEALSEEDNA